MTGCVLKNPKTNCFSYLGGKCVGTQNKSCDKCKFFKTKSQLKAEQQQTQQRIESIYSMKYKDFVQSWREKH